jgi:hypothetical protein
VRHLLDIRAVQTGDEELGPPRIVERDVRHHRAVRRDRVAAAGDALGELSLLAGIEVDQVTGLGGASRRWGRSGLRAAGHDAVRPRRSRLRRSWNCRRLRAVQRPNARHDPDRRDEDRDPNDARSDALVPALAVPEVEELVRRQVGDPVALSKAFDQLRVLSHGKHPSSS